MMSAEIDDLTPFFKDRCSMFVLLARQANVAVILRRGPTKWCRVTLWDTERDSFERGQWFTGQMYPERCDVSPDGKLFIYFAGKFWARDQAQGYSGTWTAVSRPPYLTALALWPIGDTWGGRGVFIDNRTVVIDTSSESFGARHHPDHPPGPLRVLEHCALDKRDPGRNAQPSWRNNWEVIPARIQSNRNYAHCAAWRKAAGGFILQFETEHRGIRSRELGRSVARYPSLYTLYRREGEPIALFEAHWADFDQQGRLVATAGGSIFAGTLTSRNKLLWTQLAAMDEEQPTPMETPSWAQRW
jgi:hypothetical protein